MKKLLFLLAAAMLVLTACGDAEEESKEVSNVESTDKKEDSKDSESEKEEGESNDSAEYNETILDTDNAVVTLDSITKVEDKIFDEESYVIKFAIENKIDETIEVQAQEVSADDVMIDDMVIFSQTVAGGKKANGEMEIINFDGDLPTLEESLEFKLIVANEDWEHIEEPSVKIEIK